MRTSAMQTLIDNLARDLSQTMANAVFGDLLADLERDTPPSPKPKRVLVHKAPVDAVQEVHAVKTPATPMKRVSTDDVKQYLFHNPNVTARQISQALQVRKGPVQFRLNQLHRQSLVTRSVNISKRSAPMTYTLARSLTDIGPLGSGSGRTVSA